jgi:hypothetical protein
MLRFDEVFGKKKNNKYKAVKVREDGHTFDSRAEYRRYLYLKGRQEKGEIKDLSIHTRYPLYVGNVLIGKLEDDFSYYDSISDSLVVEDVKGLDTQLSAWKRKHFKAQYGKEVVVVK